MTDKSSSSPYGWEDANLSRLVGATILLHNECAEAVEFLLHAYLDIGWSTVKTLFRTLNNDERRELITQLASGSGQPEEEISAVLHALKCFHICTENRNILAHSTLMEAREGNYLLQKCATSAGSRVWVYEVPHQIMDETVRSMISARIFMMEMGARVSKKQRGQGPLPALPEKPPLPRKLSQFRQT